MSRGPTYDPTELPFEPAEVCEQCGAGTPIGDAVYDEYKQRSFCDMTCFYDWADDYVGDIAEYYAERNLTGG